MPRKHLSQRPLHRLGSRGTLTLVALSAALLVAGIGVYVGELPSLLSSPAVLEHPEKPRSDKRESTPEENAPGVDSPSANPDDDPEKDASSTKKPGEKDDADESDDKLTLPDVNLKSVEVDDADGSKSTDRTEGATHLDTPQSPTPPSSGSQGGSSGDSQDSPQHDESDDVVGSGSEDVSDGDADDEPEDGNVFNSIPTAAEEDEFRTFLAGKASSIPGYVDQINGIVGSFEDTSKTGSLSARQAQLRTCSSLSQTLFSEYLEALNYVRSNNSQYCGQQEDLIGAYRCLNTYVSCYEEAWTVNVAYDDPSSHVDEFMAPLNGSDAHLAEFHSYYDGFSL